MILDHLYVHHFRNYESLKINFDKGIHLITGRNAQGKTNLLEAIFYLSTTKSHRTQKDADLINEIYDSFLLEGKIQKKNKKEEVRVVLNEAGKNLFIYRNSVRKVSDFIGTLNAVMFCPDDMNLFHASPRVRRRFIDMELSKVSKKYTSTLNTCQKLLKERNLYLKQPVIDDTYLEVLTNQLIDLQIIVIKQRYYFLKDLLKNALPYYEELSQDDTKLSFVYESCIPFNEDDAIMKEQLKIKYEKNKDRDIYLKQTTIGIHKDDFMFLINGRELVNYASQGQKRSVLLSMKIGLVYMIEQLIHEYPVLLLDDVFSELDERRRMKLLVSLPKEVQIFITTTEVLHFDEIEPERLHLWRVDKGSIEKL